jgi:peptidyl-prolyl cis-trans isomerase D
VWGIKGVIQSVDYSDNIVTSDIGVNISKNEFLAAYQYAKSNITDTNMSPRLLEQLRYHVLEALIDQKIMEALPNHYYNLHMSDQALIIALEAIPELRNDKGKLSSQKLQKLAQINEMSEEELLAKLKNQILQNIILSNSIYNYHTPKLLQEMLTKNEAEIYNLEVVSIKATDMNFVPAPKIDDASLESFYSSNKKNYLVRERRDFDYAYLPKEVLQNKINVSPDEISKYKEENAIEREKNSSSKDVDAAIKQQIMTEKASEFLVNLTNNIEDEIAGGLKLEEIAKKFDLKFESVKYATQKELKENKAIYSAYDDVIFVASKQDISSPIELPQSSGLLIFEVTNIESAYVAELKDVRNKVVADWKNQFYYTKNIEFLKNLDIASFAKNTTKNSNVKYDANYKIAKNNQTLPPEVINKIITLKVGEKTDVFSTAEKDMLYCGVVKNISYDNQILKDKENTSKKIQEQSINDLTKDLKDLLRKKLHIRYENLKLSEDEGGIE